MTIKTHLGPWKTNLNPWKPIWNHEKPIQTVKNHENQPGVVQGGYGWLQVVTGDSKEEVMIFRDKQTLHHNIYISSSPSSSSSSSWSQAGVMRRLQGSRDPWEQLGLARSANREEVHITITIFFLNSITIKIFTSWTPPFSLWLTMTHIWNPR